MPQHSSRWKQLLLIRNGPAFVRAYIGEGLPSSHLWNSWARYARAWRAHEMEVGEFFLYRLHRPELEESECAAFIGWRKHILALNSFNPRPYRCLTEDKLAFWMLCQSSGLPSPRVYAVFGRDGLEGATIPRLRTIDGLESLLAEERIESFVFKPVNGTRGQQIGVLRYRRNSGFSDAEGRHVERNEVERRLALFNDRDVLQQDYLIQERLEPHVETMDLAPNCPFSYRFITLIDSNGAARVVARYAKLASGDSVTDNLHAGGLACLLDDDGRCMGARSKKSKVALLTEHPDRILTLNGWKPPFLDDAQNVALRAAREFSFVRCVAWDVAIGENGPSILEGNNPWNKDIQEVYDRGLWQGVFAKEGEQAIAAGPPRMPWW